MMAPQGAHRHARSSLRGKAPSGARAQRSVPPTKQQWPRGAAGPAGPAPCPQHQRRPLWLRPCMSVADGGPSVAVAAGGANGTASAAPEQAQTQAQAQQQPGQQQAPQQPPQQEQQQQQHQWEAEMEETLKLVHLLPETVRCALEAHDRLYELLEVVMDLGRPPLARFPSGDVRLSDAPVTAEDLEQAVAKVGDFGGDNRAGIDATLHRISAMRNRSGRVVGLTCRVGRAVTGSAELVRDLICSGSSILFLGRPGVGKTTAIRELSRLCADELGKRVVIVDTSNEIGGDGDVPHSGIGRARRMQVPDPEQQHRVMIEAVENHMPEVVVIDEIGTEAECSAARTIAQRGVQLIATAHGNELENVVKNPALSDLIGGIQSVTLGDDEAKRRGVQKSIQERAAPATFDVAVEMLERNRWHVHPDVGAAVDAMLAGQHPGGQARERAADGSILKYNYNPSIPGGRGGGGGGGGAGARGAGGGAASASARSALPDAPRGGGAAAGGGGGAGGAAAGGSLDSLDLGGGGGGGSAGSSFVRRGLFGAAARDEGPVSGSMVTRRGRHVRMGTITPSEALLRLYCVDLDEERVWEVMTAMALHDKVYLCQRPEGADAVLTLRSRVKANAALRASAKAAGVPVYAIKSTSTSNMIKAFRTLLGVEPAAGGFFGAGGSRGGSMDDDGAGAGGVAGGEGGGAGGAAPPAGGRGALLFSSADGLGGAGSGASGDDDDDYEAALSGLDPVVAAEAAMLGRAAWGGGGGGVPNGSGSGASSSYKSAEEREGLEEAQLAVEQIVLPLKQAVELLPRSEAVRGAQASMVGRYKLGVEVVGAGADARLRILPAPAPAAAEAGA